MKYWELPNSYDDWRLASPWDELKEECEDCEQSECRCSGDKENDEGDL